MSLPRARELGLAVGQLPPGPLNRITDVAGVTVGHCTIDTSCHKTGVTAVLPCPGSLRCAPMQNELLCWKM